MLRLPSFTLLVGLSLVASCGSEEPATHTASNPGSRAKQSVSVKPGDTSAEVVSEQSFDGSGCGRLVPADAFLYMEAASIDSVDEMLTELIEAFDPSMAREFDIDQALAVLAMLGADPKQVRRDQPIGVALTLSGSTLEPVPTFILPVGEPKRFVRSLQTMPGHADPEARGSYVGITMGEDYRLPSGTPTIAVGLPPGQLSMRVDLGYLVNTFRPMINMGMAQLKSELSAGVAMAGTGSPIESALIGGYVDWVERIVDSAETLEMAFEVDNGWVELRTDTKMREGSVLDGFFAGEPTDVEALAAYIDDDDSLSVLAGMDMGFLTEQITPFIEKVLESAPETERAHALEALEQFTELAPLFGNGMVMTGDITVGDMKFAMYFQPTDTERLREVFREVVEAAGGATAEMLLEGPEEREVDGASVLEYGFALNRNAFSELEYAERQGALTTLFGESGLRVRVATRNDHMALTVGGDEYFVEHHLDRLGRQGEILTPDLQRAFERIEGSNTVLLYRIDIAAFAMTIPAMLSSRMGADFDVPSMNLDPIPFTAYGGVDGRVWRGGMLFNVEQLGELAEMFR